jgi:hypothetical protein
VTPTHEGTARSPRPADAGAPARAPRLDRIAEAQCEGWLGEVEGLEISLAGAEEKLAQLNAALKPSVIHLGLPAFGQIAGWSSTL